MRSSVGRVLKSGLSLLLALAASGCSLGQSGIEPPNDQIFLPSGLAIDPAGDWLYVVNSNNDLRYNAGTVLPLDLAKAKSHRGQADWSSCSSTHFEDDLDPAALADDLTHPCCVDLVNPHILNCNGRAYALADATVEIGSFGAATVVQQPSPKDPTWSDGVSFRLFVTVRADPSVTFMDVRRPLGGAPDLRCTGPRDATEPQSRNAFCDDHWRVRRPGGAEIEDNVLPEEPHSLTLDETLGILYVGHLAVTVRGTSQGGGISTIDARALVNASTPNVINQVARTVFPTSLFQGVTAVSLPPQRDPNDPNLPPPDANEPAVFAVSRSGPDITGMVLLCGDNCDTTGIPRDLTLVPGEQIKSTAFLPTGTDIRGFLLSPSDRNKGYVLHRNTPESSGSANQEALVVLDRPTGQARSILEICSGATTMEFHDTGRGNLLFITCYEGGQVYVVDPEALLVKAIIEAGHGPNALTFSPTDRTIAYVADYADNDVAVIDLEPGSPTEYKVVQRIGFPHTVKE